MGSGNIFLIRPLKPIRSKPLGWKIISDYSMLSVEIWNRILLRFPNNVMMITNDIEVYMLCVALFIPILFHTKL